MFSRFKEKLSGFKEALSSKIAEKVSQAEKIAGTVNGRPNTAVAEDENGVHGLQAEARAVSPPAEKDTEIRRSSESPNQLFLLAPRLKKKPMPITRLKAASPFGKG